MFAVLVLGSLTVIGCEKPAATSKPKSYPTSRDSTMGAPDTDKAKGEAIAKEAGAKAKADAEKAKADADKSKTLDPAKADPKVDPKADPKKDK